MVDESTSDDFEVDFYVMGVYCGKRKVGKKSICGQLLLGNIAEAQEGISAMLEELNEIPGVEAKADIHIAEDES